MRIFGNQEDLQLRPRSSSVREMRRKLLPVTSEAVVNACGKATFHGHSGKNYALALRVLQGPSEVDLFLMEGRKTTRVSG
jgi:hypothetical protein